MIYIRETKTRHAPVVEDASSGIIAVALGMAFVLGMLLLTCTPLGNAVCQWAMDAFPGAFAESTMYVNVRPGSTLNARLSPDKSAHAEYRLDRGEPVIVLGMADGWAECKVGGDTVYCSIDYLTSEPPPDKPIAATISSNGRVALRDAPEGNRIDWLHDGDRVTVAGYLNGWARVEGGYVAGKYVVQAQ